MAQIKSMEFDYPRKNTRWNQDKNKYIGYLADIRINGRRRREMFEQKKQAQAFIDSLKLEHVYKRNGLPFTAAGAPRISEVFAMKLKRLKSETEKTRARRVFEYFSKIVECDLRITEVRTAHFQKFVNNRLADGVKAATVIRELTPLSEVFRSAPELFPDVLEGFQPPRIPRPKYKKKPRQAVITEAEKNAIVGHLMREKTGKESQLRYDVRTRIGKMFEISWLLGLRLGEITKLEKSDFNFKERKLRVVRWKTGDVSLLEFLPEFICDLIQSAAEESSSNFIYSKNGKLPALFYPLLREAVKKAGLRYGIEHLDGITFHTNRHSFTSRLIQVTDLATAASYTGHSAKEMVVWYSHATTASRQTAMQKLYGKKEITDEELMEIFIKVREKRLLFDEFKQLLFP
jgi:integrase